MPAANRNFEEFNGRQRNISFVEAKGPDSISRLRAHLNVRRVNKPEDEADQGRYILRRAIVLHYHLKKRLTLLKTKNPLGAAHRLKRHLVRAHMNGIDSQQLSACPG